MSHKLGIGIAVYTHQQDVGLAVQIASAQGRCTCCSFSQSHGQGVLLGDLRLPDASHSHGSFSPSQENTLGDINCVPL